VGTLESGVGSSNTQMTPNHDLVPKTVASVGHIGEEGTQQKVPDITLQQTIENNVEKVIKEEIHLKSEKRG
jgi:hypothetical protein